MQKITLSLEDSTDTMVRERAERAGMTISAYVDKAIRRLAADEDVAVYDAWREGWSDEDKAIEAALDQADREALERGE